MNVQKDDEYLPIAVAFEKETGYRPADCTAWRWAKKGCGGVKLETRMFGGHRKTTRRFVRQFIAERTAKAEGDGSAIQNTPRREVTRRDKEIARANAQLDRELGK
ncbi:hypothetical protein Mal15_56780 [Stieleria maiorica]|uniref:Uncharacterized protein n=1 Tax=Stieleria maiorica TaxID=2795974 RepID=A0A5B9MNF5_9BACT|nr:DUF1580 domain-containing protein [Stieleria maiorica]QEG01601.1 hypothetical protein Mal15_56780 [Stieleria maiorica]